MRIPFGFVRPALPCALAAVLLSGASNAHAQAPERRWALHLPGTSHHFNPPTAPGRHWNEWHPSLGLEHRAPLDERWPGWTRRLAGGLLKDSLARWGGYAAASAQRRLWENAHWRVEAGAGAFVFYRTFDWERERRLMPAVLPVVSVEHRPSGLGANVLAVPHFRTRSGEMPGVLFAQLTLAF